MKKNNTCYTIIKLTLTRTHQGEDALCLLNKATGDGVIERRLTGKWRRGTVNSTVPWMVSLTIITMGSRGAEVS